MSSIIENLVSPAPIKTPSGLGEQASIVIVPGLNKLLADVFVLYIKTKNFHWHVSGPHFRDYHLLLDDQASALLATSDLIAERARKLEGITIRSIEEILALCRLAENRQDCVEAKDMLAELREDNVKLVAYLRALHEVCSANADVATTSMIEDWIDQAEQRIWFLLETAR
ncbi:Dps family protein [Paraburkholderia flagellata]|uniref:Dps family protein n=1 Tax=Paraburkholderia flagellata TaxID=2883241 RepID=UPI001F38349F|nr:DNA starvation/stationary phase protection protein [Paraburkholderia flagellata]